MNKASHKRKVKLARRLRTRIETSRSLAYMDKEGKPIRPTYANIFDTRAWLERKAAIKDRVERQQALAHAKALKRKALRLKTA